MSYRIVQKWTMEFRGVVTSGERDVTGSRQAFVYDFLVDGGAGIQKEKAEIHVLLETPLPSGLDFIVQLMSSWYSGTVETSGMLPQQKLEAKSEPQSIRGISFPLATDVSAKAVDPKKIDWLYGTLQISIARITVGKVLPYDLFKNIVPIGEPELWTPPDSLLPRVLQSSPTTGS